MKLNYYIEKFHFNTMVLYTKSKIQTNRKIDEIASMDADTPYHAIAFRYRL